MNNPIDQLIQDITSPIYPYLNQVKLSSNSILSISSILYALSLYYFSIREINLGITYLVIGYVVDVVNEDYTDKMNIENNESFDMTKNISFLIILSYILFRRYDIHQKYIPLIILVVFLLMTIISRNCKDNKNKQCVKNKGLLSLFGKGTFVFVLVFLIYYLDYDLSVTDSKNLLRIN